MGRSRLVASLAGALTLVACAGSTAPPAGGRVALDDGLDHTPFGPTGSSGPAPPPDAGVPDAPPPTITSEALLARLPPQVGPVAGAPCLVERQRRSRRYCGGLDVWVVLRDTPAGDPRFAAAMTQRIRRRLDTEGRGALEAFQAALAHEADQARGAGRSLAHLEAIARGVQLRRRLAALIARAPIPWTERPDAPGYCDALAGVAEDILVAAEAEAARCRDLEAAITSAPDAWWRPVCAP